MTQIKASTGLNHTNPPPLSPQINKNSKSADGHRQPKSIFNEAVPVRIGGLQTPAWGRQELRRVLPVAEKEKQRDEKAAEMSRAEGSKPAGIEKLPKKL